MAILDILLHPGLRPFEVAVGIVFGLLLLELVANQIGGSLLGNAESDMDLDAGADLGLDPGADMDVELDADLGLDAEAALEFEGGVDAAEGLEGAEDVMPVQSSSGVLSWLGLGDVPFMIWFAGMLTAFGLTGWVLQVAAASLLGAPLGPWLATGIALVPAAALGARVARWIGQLLPKTTTTAISRRSYGRRRGVITVGTARSGNPAQARFTDGHGNMHYAMVEPFDKADEIPQGAEVLILRSKDGTLKAVRLSDA
jgi:hypothetical protein